MRKAVIDSSGLVVNVIEIDLDDDGGHSHWPCPDGCTLIDADSIATKGATWDGTRFIIPIKPETPRIDILMSEGPATQVYDDGADAMVDRPAEDIAADKSELL